MRTPHRDGATVNTRLSEAAERGQPVELILVVQGRVRPTRGAGRWRIQIEGRHVITFHADSVVAATPIASGKQQNDG